MFKAILSVKRIELTQQVMRLKTGLDKLNSANSAVMIMRVQLTSMQPELEKASVETEKMMVSLTIDKDAAAIQQKAVAKEEQEATI